MLVISSLTLALAVGSNVVLATSPQDLTQRDLVAAPVNFDRRDASSHVVIPLKKRTILTTNGVADLDNMQNALYLAGQKYTTGARRFFNRTGRKLPGYDNLIKPAEEWCARMSSVRTARRKHLIQAAGAHSKRQSVQLTNQDDGLLWSGNLNIGMPRQSFNVVSAVA